MESSSNRDPVSSAYTKQAAQDGGSFTYPAVSDTVLALGKDLIREYEVRDNQKIRFSSEGYTFDSFGAAAITSLKEAREKYPNWSIPERLGDYVFADLTIHPDRTHNIGMDIEPLEKPVVFTQQDPTFYYLCYSNGSARFRISMVLLDSGEGMVSWPRHPEVLLQLDTDPESAASSPDSEPPNFISLLLLPESAGDFAYFITKLENASDCLESETINFSQEEAQSIYEGMRQGFLLDAPQ